MNLLSEARLRLPVRLKLAVVSAGLTFVILLLFAVVVGTFTVRRLNSSFDSELRSATASLADRIRLRPEPTVPEDLLSAASAGGAEIRVLDRSGRVIGSAPLNGANLGPAQRRAARRRRLPRGLAAAAGGQRGRRQLPVAHARAPLRRAGGLRAVRAPARRR